MSLQTQSARAAQGAAVQLLVLGGMQAGARSALAPGVHLLGNEACCDVMVDLGATLKTVIKLDVAARKIGITLIEGQGGLGAVELLPNRRVTLRSADLLRLGPVTVQLSFEAATSGRTKPASLLSNKKLRFIAGAAASGVAAFGLVLALALVIPPPKAAMARAQEASAAKLRGLAEVLAAQGFGELAIAPPDGSGAPVISGVLPTSADIARLASALEQERLPAVLRVTAGDALVALASAHLQGLPGVSGVRRAAAGVVVADVAGPGLARAKAAARQLLTYEPAITEVRLLLSDVTAVDASASAPPAAVSLKRLADGTVAVSEDWSAGPTQGDVMSWIIDVRVGELPSIVTRDGARLFEGGRLPDGSYIARISASQIVVRHGDLQRFYALEPVPATVIPPSGMRLRDRG